jgi:NAD(P)-dependent dehydrogenase (short-subunit alcohol dehydrogenase family)
MTEPRPALDSFSLAGSGAILTGAAGILGRVFAAALVRSGADVLLVDRDRAALEAQAQALAPQSAGGARVAVLAADLADRAGDRRIVEAAADAFGRPADALVNNAATKGADLAAFFAPDAAFPVELWREVMAVNLEAPFYLSLAFAAPLLAAGQGGAVVNIASIYGHMAPDQRIYEGSEYLGHQIRSPAAYSASKAGVIGLTRHLASLWGARGLRVNSLAPGGVGSGQNGVFAQNYARRVPMGRMAEADDMTGALVFLLSPAARYVTGQNWLVDGGLSAW